MPQDPREELIAGAFATILREVELITLDAIAPEKISEYKVSIN